ncbi:MAG: hypothetical protein GOMPHAMPRED_002308 [Gomphillus americanus]|uniref:Uncharacterized protein n=1 Tax=Gomphillus americanus TaxID=1940652 RepID=A0A8H3FDA2_9LECA|nr:MAG: hypothetical protein GOMPHAMPRED_002308 [Gomphillus americanus]
MPEISKQPTVPPNTDRPSLLDINHGLPALAEPTTSPAHSVHTGVERIDGAGFDTNTVAATSPADATFRKDSATLPLARFGPQELIINQSEPHTTPKVSDFQLQNPSPDRPRFMARRSLLSEPISFLSTATSSSRSSIQSAIEHDIIPGSIESQAKAISAQVQTNPTIIRIPRRGRLLDSRPKAARILGANLQALATEQGGIPISALSSPIYSHASEITAIPGLRSSAIAERDLASSTSPEFNSTALPQLVGTNPLRGDTFLQDSAIPSIKSSRKPEFLPMPLNVPESGGSFTRESVISTPYPTSGFGNLRPPRSLITTSVERSDGYPRSKHQISGLKIPILIRSNSGYIAVVGKIELPDQLFAKDEEVSKDDRELAKSIIREYRRLRSWRIALSARCLVGIQIVLNSHVQDIFTSEAENGRIWNEYYHLKHSLSPLEDYHTGANIAVSCASSQAAKVTTLKRDLEESLGLLLKRSSLGADSNVCSNDLRRLRLEMGRSDQSGNHRGTLALELVRGWSGLKIGITVAGIMIVSMLSTVLWILLGLNQGVSVADKTFAPIIKLGGLTINNANGSWNGAGTRVGSGAALGLLVLLLGWSWMILWIGMSWLVD